MRNSWPILLLSLLMLAYAIHSLSTFDGEATWIQWCAAAGALTCLLLAIFQCVKGIMHDMHREENFPD